jgi:hypothetical protein
MNTAVRDSESLTNLAAVNFFGLESPKYRIPVF